MIGISMIGSIYYIDSQTSINQIAIFFLKTFALLTHALNRHLSAVTNPANRFMWEPKWMDHNRQEQLESTD